MTEQNTDGSAEPDQSTQLTPELIKLSILVGLGVLLILIDGTMLSVAVNTLVVDFHSTLPTIQWTLTGYLLAMAMSIPLAGWVTDRLGARTTWCLSIGVFLVGSVLCGLAWSDWSLILFRVVQGAGAGMILPVGQATLVQAAGLARRAKVVGALSIPALIAPIGGPALGGLLVGALGWQWVFFINIPICVVAIIGGFRLVPSVRRPGGARLDVLGLLLLSPGLAFVVYGLTEASAQVNWTDPAAMAAVAVGVLLLVGFSMHALRTRNEPLIDLRLLKQRSFAASIAVLALFGIALGGGLLIPLFFQQVWQDSAEHTGLLLIPSGVGAALSLNLVGRFSAKLNPRLSATAGLALGLVGSFLYTRIGPDTSYALLVTAMIVSGLGFGFVQVAASTSAFLSVPHDQIPRASSATRMFQQLGNPIGVGLFITVLSTRLAQAPTGPGGTPDRAAMAIAFGGTFWWQVGIIAITLIPVLLLPTSIRPPAPAPEPAASRG